MNANQLVEVLVRLFPPFRGQWDDLDDNVHRNGDDFTAHGVCSEFSHFFLEQGRSLAGPAVSELFAIIETEVSSDPDDKDEVANALCTCFLENIAQTDVGEWSLAFMGRASREFFDHWHSWR